MSDFEAAVLGNNKRKFIQHLVISMCRLKENPKYSPQTEPCHPIGIKSFQKH